MFTAWVMRYGYIGISSLLMFGIVGLPVPDESLLLFAGYLVHKGDLRLVPTIVAACLGSLCGITASYCLGRFGGAVLIRRFGHLVHLSEENLRRARDWFSKAGKWALFFGYFIPGVRHLTAYAAGTSRLDYRFFALFAYTGGVIWSSGFVSAGYFFGKEWSVVAERFHRGAMIGFGAAAISIAALVLLYRWKSGSGRS